MAKLNKKQIKAMEEEFAKLQMIEIALESENSAAKKVINKYSLLPSTYTDKLKQERLLAEVDKIIADIAKTGQVRGRVMSLKTMERYLDESERQSYTQRTLDIISRANGKRAQARMALYAEELAKEKNILKADIELYKTRARLAGMSDKTITKELVKLANQGQSPVDAFKRRVETLEKAILRREAAAAEIDEYKKSALQGEEWEWITISTKPCPDCRIRAGTIMSYEKWQAVGLPGAGRTICGGFCMCKLMPVAIADQLFPEVKEYTWNKETAVLTTAQDMKIIKRNQE